MQKTIETQISAVTVYSDRALVIRRGKIQLTGEETELIVADIPQTLETESVRVSGKGTVAVRLMGVRTETLFVPQPTQEKLVRIEEEIKALEIQQRTGVDRIASLRVQRDFIKDLSEKAIEDFSFGLARQRVSLTETGDLLNFIGQHYNDYASQLAELERQQQELNDAIAALNKQKQQLQNPRPYKSLSIIVTIEPSGAGEFELETFYTVDRASWKPLYDLRVDSQTNTLYLGYLAQVTQKTGEDWSNVPLTLSTAKPGLGSLPPKLDPWYISVNSPYVYAAAPAAVGMSMQNSAPEVTKKRLTIAAPAPEIFEAESATAQVSKAGSVVTFQISGGGNIPSDGSPHQVTIFEDKYPSNFQYIAIPRLVSFAYLEAVVTNPATGVTLLPGVANIFRDYTFVGTTQLDNIAPGQEFRINLGIDEGLKIERDLVERQVDKKLFGDRRRITFAYRLTITNLLTQTNQLKLTEQLPVSRDEKIKVRLLQSHPKIEPKEMGILEWNLTMAPNSKQEVSYQFVVEYPPEHIISGLDI
ncbi:MAG: mucoidy inhibitor MuiA family protein [Hydrococcus sp. Prado102]|nr:mucoidy inhibitor MuiA family protein [Hydrococcus sp. Prado102]